MEWISVKDRLPSEYEFALVYRTGEYVNKEDCVRLEAHIKNGRWEDDWIPNTRVTHWMTLPTPPHEIDDSVFLMTNKED